MRKLSFFCIILSIILALSGCADVKKTFKTNKLKVVASFNAVSEFAEAVGQDKIELVTLVPDGLEPHDFEPKVRDLENLSDADVFIYNGFGMESWTDDTLKAVGNSRLIVVDASKGSVPIINTDSSEIKDHGQYDPHLWLSLIGAEKEAENIKDAFIKADYANKAFYENNFNNFKEKLSKLYLEYKSKFSTVKNKEFVTGHAAFAYFCRDFGLNQNSVEDVFAEGEPSAKRLKELTDFCINRKINTVFVEEMVSPKVSTALAKEVGAKVVEIHTIESKEEGKDYIKCMTENLEVIYNSMK